MKGPGDAPRTMREVRAMRYSERDAAAAFERLAKLLGKETAGQFTDMRFRPGGTWRLDYAAEYGGFEIREWDGHGEAQPLGSQRMPARQFCEAVWFAEKVLAEYQRTRGDIDAAQGYPSSVLDVERGCLL